MAGSSGGADQHRLAGRRNLSTSCEIAGRACWQRSPTCLALSPQWPRTRAWRTWSPTTNDTPTRRARRASEVPKFELLPLDMLIAVDALQSLYGVGRPFSVWADWRDVFRRGIRYDVPDVPVVPQSMLPLARFLHVGREWDDSANPSEWTGLRDPAYEAWTADSACAPDLVQTVNGRAIWALPTGPQFEVDMEAAYLIAEFEVDRLLGMYDAGCHPERVTGGYRWYAQYGCLELSHSQRAEHDEIARRTAFKGRLGLTLDYDVRRVGQLAVAFEAIPDEAKQYWATSVTPQAELAFS